MASCVLRIMAGYHQKSLCGHESSLKTVDSKAGLFQSVSDQSPASRPAVITAQSGE